MEDGAVVGIGLVSGPQSSGALAEDCFRTPFSSYPLIAEHIPIVPVEGLRLIAGERECELLFAHAVREFDARERSGRCAEGLESEHGRAALFDCSMILFDEITKVAIGANTHLFPPWVFLVQLAQAAVHCAVSIEVDFRWPENV